MSNDENFIFCTKLVVVKKEGLTDPDIRNYENCMVSKIVAPVIGIWILQSIDNTPNLPTEEKEEYNHKLTDQKPGVVMSWVDISIPNGWCSDQHEVHSILELHLLWEGIRHWILNECDQPCPYEDGCKQEQHKH